MRALLVTKPLVPPWNDSAKNLADETVRAATHTEFDVLVPRGERHAASRARSVGIYATRAGGGFAPSLGANLRVLRHLLFGARPDVCHYFFAPNARTSTVARAVRALRRVPTVQTVCSQPLAFEPNLFFGDRVVALSRWARGRIVDCGVPAARVVHVPPGISPPRDRSAAERVRARVDFGVAAAPAPLVVYPGDLGFSRAAQTDAAAWPAVTRRMPGAQLVFACRGKGPATERVRASIERERSLGDSAHFVGDTDRIHDLLATADVVTLPAETLYAKMDLPLVLLESLALGIPIVVADADPVREVLEDGRSGPGEVGLAVPPLDAPALAIAILSLLGDPIRRAAMGEAGRRLVRERFAPALMVAAIEAIYDEVR